MKKTTSQRLKEIMNNRGLRQVDILDMVRPYSEKYNVRLGKNDLSQYVSGKVEPSQEKLSILSLALGITEPWLMGYEDVSKSTANKIPLIGRIAAGAPILAEQNIEDYFNLDSSIKADFCLKIQGDSMIDEHIYDGDIVFIKQQQYLENGQIGAILVEDEATLKIFYKEEKTVILQPANKEYKPLIYTKGDIYIMGKLVAVLNIRN